jgi:predicted O-linked N-acetylglucosamine transferase (SPINDLY family)
MAPKFFEFFKAKAVEPVSDPWASLKESAAKALQSGELDSAVRLYGAVIEADGNFAEGHYKLGNALNRLGRWQDAVAAYEKAIMLDSNYANAYCNRGAVLQRLDRLDEALDSYDRAVALNPADFLTYYNRGSVLKALGRFDEALASYEQCVALRSDYAAAYLNRGQILQELKRFEAAVASYEKVIELSSEHAEAHQNRGFSLAQLRRFDAALVSYDRALELNPAYAEEFQGRVYSLVNLGRFKDAIEIYDRVLSANSNQRYLAGLRVHAKMQICDWQDLARELTALAESLNAGNAASPPFPLLSALDSPAVQRRAAELWVREQCPADDRLGPIPKRPRGDKIRVAYFSPDFRNHAVSQATAELFERHDRSRFEVLAFSIGPRANDSMRGRLEQAFGRFIDASDQSDIETALLARTLGVDIAVDLGGYTEFCRSKIFALRAAPVQVNYLGYPSTMGAPYMDYLIGDQVVIPQEQLGHYAEKVAFLPHSYFPHDSASEVAPIEYTRAELGLPARGFVFCCFNKKYKITPAMFDSWMRILSRTPASVLWLSLDDGAAVDNLRLEASRCGVDPYRLIFADRVESLSHHLARLRAADLFLDTLPYNAHATATDALWAGLPVLTLKGQSFASRVSASLLSTIGLGEMIVSTAEDYEEMAIRLATNSQLFDEIKRKLAQNRLTTPLFDTRSFARNLEDAFVSMHERYLTDLPPEHIFVKERR